MGCCYAKIKSPPSSPSPIFDKELETIGPTAPKLESKSFSKQAYIVSVYDGDTFTAAIRHESEIVRVKCRVKGIDTPEMKPLKSKPNREEEIKKAKEAKEVVEKMILGKYIKLNVTGLDKYGRYLVSVNCPDTGKPISDILIAKKLAYSYDGGTKIDFI